MFTVSDVCVFAECSLTLHLVSVRDRMKHGLIRKFCWIVTMDMLVDDLTNGGIDRLPEQFAVPHIRALVANSSPGRREVGFEHRNVGT